MPLITATWKVTLTSVILLDKTDYMQDEPRLTRAFISDRVPALAAASIVYLGRKNLSHVASFTRVIAFGSDYEARLFMETHTLALPSAPDDCTIEWLYVGNTSVPSYVIRTLADCVVAGYNARTENNFFFADYTLQGGALG